MSDQTTKFDTKLLNKQILGPKKLYFHEIIEKGAEKRIFGRLGKNEFKNKNYKFFNQNVFKEDKICA